MATTHYVAEVGELAEGQSKLIEVNGREIGVFNVRGRYYALPNICLHQSGPLCAGRLSGTFIARASTQWQMEWVREGEILRCPWHSLEFDVTSGQCLGYPKRRIRTYEVKVEDGKIMVVA